MNILVRMILAAMLLICFSRNVMAGEKAKLGPCVRQCIQAFNPSLADSAAAEFMAEDFRKFDQFIRMPHGQGVRTKLQGGYL